MYEKELQEAGLSEHEANVYTVLILENGLPASVILKKVNEKNEIEFLKNNKKGEIKKLSRQNAYKIIDDLIRMNLAKKEIKKKGSAIFHALHPKNLEENLKKESFRIENSRNKLKNIIDDLGSTFDLNSEKPGIKFYNNISNPIDFYNDMLKSKETIYTYFDPTAEIENPKLSELSMRLAEDRKSKKVKKKAIFFNVPGAKELAEKYTKINKFTEIKISKKITKDVKTVMHIYNNKIVYMNFSKKNKKTNIFVIQDKNIYNLQRSIFEDE